MERVQGQKTQAFKRQAKMRQEWLEVRERQNPAILGGFIRDRERKAALQVD